MERIINVNQILLQDITKIDSDFNIVPSELLHTRKDLQNPRVLIRECLTMILDDLGEQSARAQGLSRVLTTAAKLRNSNHTLYLLKDEKARGGKGEVIGFLKVGYKHLYLHDENGKTCQREPLCVLDFFVLDNYQRHGYGKKLFDYMLEDTNCHICELAIDGPSLKMENFLCRNYEVKRLLRQSNNFAVAPEFFEENLLVSPSNSITMPHKTESIGRYAAPKPRSIIGSVIHGSESYYGC